MMKIDTFKLKKVAQKKGGEIEAQCPACAASGHDATGNHLIVYPSGEFGCVVNPKDKAHNAEILKLVGAELPDTPTPRKVIMRPFRAAPSKKLCEVPRRTLQELGMKRGENSRKEEKT